jgi:hypothetical protein
MFDEAQKMLFAYGLLGLWAVISSIVIYKLWARVQELGDLRLADAKEASNLLREALKANDVALAGVARVVDESNRLVTDRMAVMATLAQKTEGLDRASEKRYTDLTMVMASLTESIRSMMAYLSGRKNGGA